MLQPKGRKFRKDFKGRNRGVATRGNRVSFGEFGLRAIAHGRITARQIEAARRAITRAIKRGGKVTIRVFPDKPVTKKPLEVRQGKGKGNVEYWVDLIQPGRMLFEIEGVTEELAREAFARAAAKLPFRCIFCEAQGDVMKAQELRTQSVDELRKELTSLYREQFNLRMQKGLGESPKTHLHKRVRRDIARVKTLIHEKERGHE